MDKKLFVVFSIFVLVVAITMATGKHMEMMLFISMLANLFVIYTHCRADKPDLTFGLTKTAGGAVTDSQATGSADDSPAPIPPEDAYGDDYREHQEYNRAEYFSTFGRANNIDMAAVDLTRRRTRDKRAMDAATVKDANYYRYHYADELEAEEKKRWWGNHEW